MFYITTEIRELCDVYVISDESGTIDTTIKANATVLARFIGHYARTIPIKTNKNISKN